jgi:hypothetical protein
MDPDKIGYNFNHSYTKTQLTMFERAFGNNHIKIRDFLLKLLLPQQQSIALRAWKNCENFPKQLLYTSLYAYLYQDVFVELWKINKSKNGNKLLGREKGNFKIITSIKGETVEENSSNFGHDLMKVFKNPQTTDFTKQTWDVYNSSKSNEKKNYDETNYDKQGQKGGMTNFFYVNDDEYSDMTHDESKKYFNLKKVCKYVSEENKTFDHNADEPTLSLSLFIRPFSKNEPPMHWAVKYIILQLRAISLFKYFYPKGYTRLYMDKFLVEYLKNNEIPISIEQSFLQNNEHSKECKNSVQEHLQKIYEDFSSLKDKQYSNNFQKFVELYDIASRSFFENNNVNYSLKNESGITIFIYEFKGHFSTKYDIIESQVEKNLSESVAVTTGPPILGKKVVENKKLGKTCGHIMQGSIGQLIRFISLAQKPYSHNGINMNSPKILLFRDGHSNPMGQYDYEWTNEVIKLAQSEKKNIILLPSNVDYSTNWHDVLETIGKKLAPIAGQITSCNFSENVSHFTKNEFYRTIGSIFLLNPDETLPLITFLKKIEHPLYVGVYGIDEFLMTPFYQIESIVNRSIYRIFSFIFLKPWIIDYHDNKYALKKLALAYVILTHYLVKIGELQKNESNIIKVTDSIESLRNYASLKKNPKFKKYANEIMKENNIDVAINKFGLYLGLYPNKYHILHTIFNQNFIEIGNNVTPEKYAHELTNVAKINENQIDNFVEIALNNPDKLNILCSDLIFMSPIDITTSNYLYKTITVAELCEKNYYTSGFYDTAIEDIPFPILRTPKDLKYMYNKYMKNGKTDTKSFDIVQKRDKMYENVFEYLHSPLFQEQINKK